MHINLLHFGVRGEDGQDLQPADNPHAVSDAFGLQLVRQGRARRAPEGDPDAPPARPDSAVGISDPPAPTHGDPATTHGDPPAAPTARPPRKRR